MDTKTFKENADDLSDQVRRQFEQAKRKLGRINGRAMTFIQDHPAACLVGALALGYLVARALRRWS